MARKLILLLFVALMIMGFASGQVATGEQQIDIDFSWVGGYDGYYNLSSADYPNIWLTLKPFLVHTNGNYYGIQFIHDNYPTVSFGQRSDVGLKTIVVGDEELRGVKWGINITGIPDNLKDNVEYIAFVLHDKKNIQWDDVELDYPNKQLVLFDTFYMNFQDLLDLNYTVTLFNKSTILVGNTANRTNLYLDPLVGSSDQTAAIRTTYMEHMVKTSNDYMFASYRDSDNDWRVSYSTNNGSSWTSVEVDAGNYRHPNIGAKNNDYLYSISLAPITDDIYMSTSINYGVTWTTPIVVASHPVNIYNLPVMSIGKNGYIHLTYDEDNYNNMYYMFHNNVSWSTPLILETSKHRTNSHEVDSTDMLHIIANYGTTSDIKWYNCSANCNVLANWDSQVVNSHSDALRKPDLAIDSLDGLAITYSDITANKSRLKFNYYNRSSKSWRYTQLPASANNQDIIQSGIAIDSLDVFHVMWIEDDSVFAWQNIYYTNSSDYGYTWETPVEILSGSATDNWQSVNMRGTNYPISNRITDRLDYIAHDITSNEILYYNKTLLEFAPDTAPPNVTLNYPPDNYNNTLKNVNFNVGATDDYELANCSLWHNISGTWHLNETKAYSGVNDTDYFIAWDVPNSCYIWNAECCDTSGNCAFHSTNYSFCQNYTIYPPVIVLNNILNESFINISWAILNATVEDANGIINEVFFYANDDINKLNKTCGFVYMAENVTSGTELIYNLTALPVKPNATGLQALYHFDDAEDFGESATNVYDWSGNGFNCSPHTTKGHNISVGKFAGAYEYDGDVDYVECENITGLNGVTEFTVMGWVKLNELKNQETLFTKAYDGSNFISLGTGTSTYEGNDNLRAYLYFSPVWSVVSTTADMLSADDDFHLWALTFNGSETTALDRPSIYYDGIEYPLSSIGSPATTTPSGLGNFTIGWQSIYNRSLNGTIDEVAVFNRSLTASEILDYYRLKDGTYYWKVTAEDDESLIESDIWEFYINLTCNFTCSDYYICNISDLQVCNDTVENNYCGKPYTGDYSEFPPQACNYCSEDLYQTNSSCHNIGGLNKIIVNYTDYNYSSCCVVTGFVSDCSILYAPYNVTNYVDCDFVCDMFGSAEYGVLEDKIYFVCETSMADGYCYSYIKDSAGGIVQVNPQKNIKSGSFKLIAEKYEDRDNFTLTNGIVSGYYTKDNLLFDDRSYSFGVICQNNNTVQEIWVNRTVEYENVNTPTTRFFWVDSNTTDIILGIIILVVFVILLALIIRFIR